MIVLFWDASRLDHTAEDFGTTSPNFPLTYKILLPYM